MLLYVAFVLGFGYYNDWQPAEGTESLTLNQSAQNTQAISTDSTLRFMIWNVGYGGLGSESDFSYDDEGMLISGSSMVRSPRDLVEKNIAGAVNFLKKSALNTDFFLLQEVDVESDRSYRIEQWTKYCQEALPEYAASLAMNYQCDRVPIPILEPWNALGKVRSGLGTFSRYQPSEAVRYQLPGHYPMPDRMFQLDRCAALHRQRLSNGKDLVVINIHNSAYDPGDKIKAIQLPFLRDLATTEFQKGNYVVMGGDWNQCPPFFKFDSFVPAAAEGYSQGNIPDDFFPHEWVWAYDPTVPTNRKCRDPYEKGKTFETLIDFYLVSPNVQVVSVKGVNMDFEFSDHQPVRMEVKLKS